MSILNPLHLLYCKKTEYENIFQSYLFQLALRSVEKSIRDLKNFANFSFLKKIYEDLHQNPFCSGFIFLQKLGRIF